jgi:hypothetical protein
MDHPSRAPSQPVLSDSARTAIHLAIFFHVFAVAVASISYTRTSSLLQSVRQVVGVYTQPLNFDLSYRAYTPARLYLTHGDPTDVDFHVAVDAQSPGGKASSTTLADASAFSGQRLLRYQTLANMTGTLSGTENAESYLPKAVAGHVLGRQSASRGGIVCRAHYLLERSAMRSPDPSQRDPFAPARYETVYDANVVMTDGQADLHKRVDARETAPVREGG